MNGIELVLLDVWNIQYKGQASSDLQDLSKWGFISSGTTEEVTFKLESTDSKSSRDNKRFPILP